MTDKRKPISLRIERESMATVFASISQALQFGSLLGLSAALKDRLLDRHLLPLGITAAQLKVLKIICSGDDTAAALCRRLSIHSAAMTRMLDRLECKGLIVRNRSSLDRREARLALTKTGEALRSKLMPMEIAAMNEFTASLSSDEVSRLEDLLAKIVFTGAPGVSRIKPN